MWAPRAGLPDIATQGAVVQVASVAVNPEPAPAPAPPVVAAADQVAEKISRKRRTFTNDQKLEVIKVFEFILSFIKL